MWGRVLDMGSDHLERDKWVKKGLGDGVSGQGWDVGRLAGGGGPRAGPGRLTEAGEKGKHSREGDPQEQRRRGEEKGSAQSRDRSGVLGTRSFDHEQAGIGLAWDWANLAP